MKSGVGAGSITIRASLSDGHVCSAQVDSTRPLSFAPLFVGRGAMDAPMLAGRLFSLCGYAHKAASHLAVMAAQGLGGDGAAFTPGIVAERIADHLRSLVIGWPDGGIGGLLPAAEAGPVRDGLAVCRDVLAGQTVPPARLAALAQLAGQVTGAEIRQRALAALPADQVFQVPPPDSLLADDDDDVVAAMAAGGADFAAAPYLPGRIVETGAYARCWSPAAEGTALTARLTARLTDLAQAVDLLLAGSPAPVCAWGALPGRQGYGVVESPRGRLYHWVRLDARGTIADYAIVAPTEWNFQSTGPFVSTLLGARTGGQAESQRLISWLAALFDPCVPFRVIVAEDCYA